MANEDEKFREQQEYLNRQRDEAEALWKVIRKQEASMIKHNMATSEFVDFVCKKRKEQKKMVEGA